MSDSFDTLIRGARIFDGSGAAAVPGDVGIRGDRIAGVGDLAGATAKTTIDAAGRCVCPGLVDAHIHTDLMLLADPAQAGSIYQGVTSHVIGQDGVSYAPASPATQRYFRDYFAAINGDPVSPKTWSSVREYLDAVDGAAVNAAYLLPHGTIRYEVMGHENRPPTGAELARMQALVAQGMAEGAVGISSGLEYLPGGYADTEELVAVCEPVGRAGGVYVTHMRSYQIPKVEEAFWETIEIGRRARLPVHISHYNGRAEQLGGLIERAVAAGADVSYETYPYMAGCTILAMKGLPQWVQEGGGAATLKRLADPAIRQRLVPWFTDPVDSWEAFQITYADLPEDRRFEGLRISEAARLRGQEVGDFICDILIRNRFRVAAIIHASWRTEADVRALASRPEHMGGSDGIYTGSRPHPRGWGSFARFLQYAQEDHVLPLETMIHHLSDRPARRFGLHQRGQVRVGWFADLLLFDPARIRARSTYENGAQVAAGMDWVWVNGQAALAKGEATGVLAGRAARPQPARVHA